MEQDESPGQSETADGPVAPGGLWERIRERTRHGLARGALVPIDSDSLIVPDGGIDFVVRVVPELERKDQARLAAAARRDVDPFLPCDLDLCVGQLGLTHTAVLNKYNVIENHLLVVTRDFEPQEHLLSLGDFEAADRCLRELDGLVFYNGGAQAGASQPHKHLQWVPLPLGPGGPGMPVEVLLASRAPIGQLGRVPGLAFAHVAARWDYSAGAVSGRLLRLYLDGLDSLGLMARPDRPEFQAGPYNLLLTRHWMILIARSQEFAAGISVNALGYAGSLLVRRRDQIHALRSMGPLALLGQAGVLS